MSPLKRVMIVGQPGSGKSTLAKELGKLLSLPVVHIDHIHWQAGWIERSGSEKGRLCAEAHAKDLWIFEGGRSSTWLERADTRLHYARMQELFDSAPANKSRHRVQNKRQVEELISLFHVHA